MITAITLTGDRHASFELCKFFMERQTVKPDQWIVIDDGAVPINKFDGATIIRREPQVDDPQHTLCKNLEVALPFVKHENIMFIEDDDYYGEKYIESMLALLEKKDIVGIGQAKYYNLIGKYYEHSNKFHASLASTAMKSSKIQSLYECLEGDAFIDMRLWHISKVQEWSWEIVYDDMQLFCGIKGMPGRKGIGIGHNTNFSRFTNDDENRTVLKKWTGEDYKIYMKIIEDNDYKNN